MIFAGGGAATTVHPTEGFRRGSNDIDPSMHACHPFDQGV